MYYRERGAGELAGGPDIEQMRATGELEGIIGIPGVDLRRDRVPANVESMGEEPRHCIFFEAETKRLHERIKPWVYKPNPETGRPFLTSYQEAALTWSARRCGSLLWHPCGAGKTLTALLWLAVGSVQVPGVSPSSERKLVVTRAPARRQWQRETTLYTNMKPTLVQGQDSYDLGDAELVIISWEIVKYWRRQIEQWVGDHAFALVFDEIHKGKSWKRKERYVRTNGRPGYRDAGNRAAAVAHLSKLATRRLGLTATPIRDRLSDLQPQLDLIEPGCWGSNWDWVHRYCDAKEGLYGGLDVAGRSNIPELKARLATVTHVVSREELARQLPPKRRQLVYLSKEDQGRPTAFAKDLKLAAKKGKQALFEMKLLAAASAKRKWITETVVDAVEAGQKAVIMTGRRKDCEVLAESVRRALKKIPDIRVWSGHGGDTVAVRDKMVQEYAACEDPCAFIGTTDAFGEAVDGLQNTDLVVFGLLPWTPGQVIQAEGRFSRHGSKRRVLIMYTVASGTVDEHVADFLLSKLEVVEEVLGDKESGDVARTLAGADDEDAILASILEAANALP